MIDELPPSQDTTSDVTWKVAIKVDAGGLECCEFCLEPNEPLIVTLMTDQDH